MNVASRGLAVLVGGTAVAIALSTSALATPAQPGSTGIKTVDSCNQSVSAATYACFAVRRSDIGFTPKAAISPQATPSGFGPSGLRTAYKLPSASAGGGQRIYLVDAFDDPNAAADLAAYRTQFGLPACTVANGTVSRCVAVDVDELIFVDRVGGDGLQGDCRLPDAAPLLWRSGRCATLRRQSALSNVFRTAVGDGNPDRSGWTANQGRTLFPASQPDIPPTALGRFQ